MPAEPSIDALIEEHKPTIAAAWRRLERLLKEFHNEIAGTVTVDETDHARKNEIPVQPVEIYPPRLENPKDPDSDLIGLKKPLPIEEGRIAAAEAYAQVTYKADEPANQSVTCYGVIGVPLRLIKLAKSVNQAKNELKAAIAPVSNRRVRIGAKDREANQTAVSMPLHTKILRSIQQSHINLQACYRLIPVIDEPASSIKFSYINTRTVARKTAGELIKILDEPKVSIDGRKDLIKLRMLDGNEYLARPSNYYRRMRVTVKLNRRANPGKRKQARLVLPADLPIVFLMRDSMARPDFVMPTFEGCGVQQPPPRMESSVYVKTLRYHRMLPEYRELKGAPKKA